MCRLPPSITSPTAVVSSANQISPKNWPASAVSWARPVLPTGDRTVASRALALACISDDERNRVKHVLRLLAEFSTSCIHEMMQTGRCRRKQHFLLHARIIAVWIFRNEVEYVSQHSFSKVHA
jgi:hypothetical protein